MDKHLTNIQSVTKAALDGFEKSGLNTDSRFIEHFLTESIDCMTETCKRYEAEAKWRTPYKQMADTTKATAILLAPNVSAFFSDLTTSPFKTMKRKSGDSLNVEETKKSKSSELNWIFGENASQLTKSQIRHTIFSCVHCTKKHEIRKPFYGTIDAVYGHWLAKHANESTSKSFQFYAMVLIKCFYCEKIGTYNDLVKHHQNVHMNQGFGILDRFNSTECGICHLYIDKVEHFHTMHNGIVASKVSNPIHYTDERIAELLLINVYNEPQCQICMQIFGTQTDLVEHYVTSHDGRATPTDSGDRNQPLYLICGYCQKQVDQNQLVNHFKVHVYDFKCTKCVYHSVNLVELIVHEKNAHGLKTLNHHTKQFSNWLKTQYLNTNLVFDNGFVVKNSNLHGTQYDNSHSFDLYLDEFFDMTKERVLQRTAGNRNARQTTTQEMVTSTTDPSILTELNEQRKLAKNLYIRGAPHNVSDIGLHELFQRLCKKLDLDLPDGDVKEILQCKNGLIVKLHRIELKDMILCRMNEKTVWSSNLVDLPKDKKPWKIQVYHQMTKFYSDIWLTATEYKENGAIHSFKLNDCGVVVRRSKDDVEHVIQSKQQLDELIHGN